MEIPTLVSVLEESHQAAHCLQDWGVRDVRRAQRILQELAESGLTLDLLAGVCEQLAEHLPRVSDPDAALHAFRRYLFAVRSPLGLAALLERDSTAMPVLLAALSFAPRWTELLVDDPEAFDLLRQTQGQPVEREMLSSDVLTEVAAFSDDRAIVAALQRIRRRHLLRIGYAELISRQPLETGLQQLTQLAEALIEAALRAAERKVANGQAPSRLADARRSRSAVIALGGLGGGEVEYRLPLELLFVYEPDAADTHALRTIRERYDRIARLMTRWLAEASEAPKDFVRLMFLPDSGDAALVHTADDVVIGFESWGRTWHRQHMLKARTVAGDRDLGEAVLSRLQPWLFRRYLTPADETGIQALKRRIMLDATMHQDDWRDVRLARGGLRDIQSTVEFLQLLSGGEHPAARQTATLTAIAGLAVAGTLSSEERNLLAESLAWLRQLQNCLHFIVSPETNELPANEELLTRIAALTEPSSDTEFFQQRLRRRLDDTWHLLSRLLDSAFAEESAVPREVELLLDPSPPPAEVRAALAPFGFSQPTEALATINGLAKEDVPFLSTRRCRHQLAAILPQLLCAISGTPSPDRTLDNIASVSNSLGAKGVLWDLCRASSATLQLYVKLCAASPYLSSILTTNPGMIDELVDSLQLDKLPTEAELTATLAELCRGAKDTLPILHDFKNAAHLRIGVRDLLGKDDIDHTHQALAAVAEICLSHVAELEFKRLVEKYGRPSCGPGPQEGQPSRPVIVGLSKLGGQDPNYHSQLDILFLYQSEGLTRPASRSRQGQRTANNHFYTQWAQAIIKQISQLTPKGRLYSMAPLLRPIGVGGAMALSLADFEQHFASGAAPLWQWQALCQARPVCGETSAREQAAAIVRQLLLARQPTGSEHEDIRRLRLEHEKGASPQNLKRATGGTLDIEFLVQMLQLQHAARQPAILTANTQAALTALSSAGVLPREISEKLGDGYRFLRRVESGLRLLGASARHDLPIDPPTLHQLAYLLGHTNPQRLRQQCLDAMATNRGLFDALTTQS